MQTLDTANSAMAARHIKQASFTTLTNGQLRGLYTAGASANEVLAYALLTRWHNDPEHPARCWHNAQLGADVLGMREDTFTRSLRRLTEKAFARDAYGPVAVLTKITGGHNGRSVVYNDNLYAVMVLRDLSQVGRQGCLPTETSRKANRTGYVEQSRKAIQTELQGNVAFLLERTYPTGGAVLDRNRTACVSQPCKYGSTSKSTSLVSGSLDEPIEGQLRPVTFEQFAEVARLLEEGAELSVEQKETYSRGYATHNVHYIEGRRVG